MVGCQESREGLAGAGVGVLTWLGAGAARAQGERRVALRSGAQPREAAPRAEAAGLRLSFSLNLRCLHLQSV